MRIAMSYLLRLFPIILFIFLAGAPSFAQIGGATPEPVPLPREEISITPSKPSVHPPEFADLMFKRQVRRVIVDVVVTDSHGKSVRGLTQKDFSVNEDGKAQQILSFDPHFSDSPPDFVPPKIPPLPPNSFVNVPAAPER